MLPEKNTENNLQDNPSSNEGEQDIKDIDNTVDKKKSKKIKSTLKLNSEEFDFTQNDDDLDINDSEKNYSELKKEELLEKLRELINEKPVETIMSDVEAIKSCFYKIINAEKEKIRTELLKGGGADEGIKIPKDISEDYLKELLADYKNKKQSHIEELEKEKKENLKKKEEIIEKIKILANGEESLNKTFSEFKELQKMWNNIGPVPNSESSKLWNNYQLQIERFYDFIKINRELRDLDLKKNLENKIELCEKAEDLLIEQDVRKAYQILQEYHELWKEIGPVEIEKRKEVWERFSETTKKIRKNYQEYFIEIKKEREDNYKQKIALCEKVEHIVNEDSAQDKKEWIKNYKEILKIQKLWKTIGMVPREVNDEIYERFRTACNRFFEDKKDYFNIVNEELDKNLQTKIDICVQAEGIQDNTDWKKTSEMFFDLQKKWKEIGTVPAKQSNAVWKRFRAACDKFFNAKETYFNNLEKQQEENSIKKKELIKTIKNIQISDNQADNIKKVKELQSKWIDIGLVLNKDKDKLQKEYKDAVNDLYSKMNLSRKQVDSHNFQTKIESLKSFGNMDDFTDERKRIIQKIKIIEDDIRLWENNMTFFSKGSKGLLSDFENKVNKAKEELAILNNRKKMVDLSIRELKKNKEEKSGE